MKLYTETLVTSAIKNMVGHKIFKAMFVKRNGEVREMNCRLEVKKHLKGGKDVNNKDRYLTVYDLKSKGYRNINLNTIIEIRCGGNIIKRFTGNTGNIYVLAKEK
tara:strand:+ start:699 stop:1013 length:315 start_codon:yes stop_codon:yes gene_type:complete